MRVLETNETSDKEGVAQEHFTKLFEKVEGLEMNFNERREGERGTLAKLNETVSNLRTLEESVGSSFDSHNEQI